MESIKETIDNTFSGKYYISYSKVLDLNKVKKEFEDNIAKKE